MRRGRKPGTLHGVCNACKVSWQTKSYPTPETAGCTQLSVSRASKCIAGSTRAACRSANVAFPSCRQGAVAAHPNSEYEYGCCISRAAPQTAQKLLPEEEDQRGGYKEQPCACCGLRCQASCKGLHKAGLLGARTTLSGMPLCGTACHDTGAYCKQLRKHKANEVLSPRLVRRRRSAYSSHQGHALKSQRVQSPWSFRKLTRLGNVT